MVLLEKLKEIYDHFNIDKKYIEAELEFFVSF